MLFEELIEQHRVDLIVANAVGFPFFVHCYQRRIHLCYFFSNQTKLGDVGLVVLVVEGHRFKRENRFTGLVHGVNILLEPLRGDASTNTELAGDRVNRYVATERATTENASDKGLRLGSLEANTDGIVIRATTVGANFDIVTTSHNIDTGAAAQRDVVRTGSVAECVSANGSIVVASCVRFERAKTDAGIIASICVVKGFKTICRAIVGAGVVNQGLPACRRIAVAACVGKQGLKPVGRVVAAGGVLGKRKLTDGSVEAAFCGVRKGSYSNGCIRNAGAVE